MNPQGSKYLLRKCLGDNSLQFGGLSTFSDSVWIHRDIYIYIYVHICLMRIFKLDLGKFIEGDSIGIQCFISKWILERWNSLEFVLSGEIPIGHDWKSAPALRLPASSDSSGGQRWMIPWLVGIAICYMIELPTFRWGLLCFQCR